MSRLPGRVSRLLAVLALACAGVGLPSTSAHASGYEWFYAKNQSDPLNSSLALYLDTYSFVWGGIKAGSGNGATITDECSVKHGWIPNGYSAIPSYSYNWPGTDIHGPVVRISDRYCYNGTIRNELFIHSEYPWNSGGYSSLGCVKVGNSGGPTNASGHIKSVVDKQAQYLATQMGSY